MGVNKGTIAALATVLAVSADGGVGSVSVGHSVKPPKRRPEPPPLPRAPVETKPPREPRDREAQRERRKAQMKLRKKRGWR